MDKIEIKNATIIDGLGGDPYVGNLYLNNGKIIAMTHGEILDSDISIDATGKVVTPGFIDLHTHSDLSFLLDSTAQSKVRQGVTISPFTIFLTYDNGTNRKLWYESSCSVDWRIKRNVDVKFVQV